MNAWTESGTRPEFDVVTGVSTGAIVSIFAFLGSEYDQKLKNYYTRTTADEMFKRNSIFQLPFRNSMVDVSGFEFKVRDAVDTLMVNQLAVERSKGRILLIATTSLDNEKMAIWDVGKIAQLGTLQAQQLIQDIIIASSAVPGLFLLLELHCHIREERSTNCMWMVVFQGKFFLFHRVFKNLCPSKYRKEHLRYT